jgi:hypothetical protein
MTQLTSDRDEEPLADIAPPVSCAVLPFITQLTSDRDEELLADIAPPAAIEEHDWKCVVSICAETWGPETVKAPPSATAEHWEKSVDDTKMSTDTPLPPDSGEVAKTAPPSPPGTDHKHLWAFLQQQINLKQACHLCCKD